MNRGITVIPCFRRGVLALAAGFVLLGVDIASAQQSVFEPGTALMDSGRYQDALAVFHDLEERLPTSDSLDYYIGRCLFATDELDASAKAFERAIQQNTTSSLYYQWLGIARSVQAQEASIFRKPGLAKKCRSALERAVELDGENLDARYNLLQYYIMAPGIMGGSEEKARVQAQEIERLDPRLGCRAMVSIHENAKEYEEAEKIQQRYLAENPADSLAKLDLGFYYQRREAWAKAREVFESLVRRHPDWPDPLYQVGRTGVFCGEELEQAEEAFYRFIAMDKGTSGLTNSYAYYRLGNIYEHSERWEDALKAYRTALELDSTNQNAQESLNRLEGKR